MQQDRRSHRLRKWSLVQVLLGEVEVGEVVLEESLCEVQDERVEDPSLLRRGGRSVGEDRTNLTVCYRALKEDKICRYMNCDCYLQGSLLLQLPTQ